MKKVLNITMWALVGVSAFLILALFFNLSDETTLNSWINTNLVWSYILFAITAGAAVISGLLQMIIDPAAAKKSLVAVIGIVVIFGIAYMLSPDEMPRFFGVDKFIEDGTLTLTVSKWIDTGLIVTYILFALTLLATIYWSVVQVFKK